MFQNCLKWLFTSTLFSPCSYRLDKNEMLLKFLRMLITVMYFKDRNWISKTTNCISCFVVCEIVFAPNFSIFPTTLAKSREERGEGEEGEEEHRQLQSVMRFTQTQKCVLMWKTYCFSHEVEDIGSFSNLH